MTRFNQLAAAAMAFAFMTSAFAQQRAGETIEVSIVNVDVYVTDKKGNPISGLTAGDFEIREEGRVQPITNFAEYAATAKVHSQTGVSVPHTNNGVVPATTPSTAPRTIILFMEHVSLASFRSKEVFDSMRALVHRAVRPGDRVMFVTWDFAMRVRQPLTDDLGALDKALDTLQRESTRAGTSQGERVRRELEAIEAADDDYESALAAKGIGAPGGRTPMSPYWSAKKQFWEIRRKTLAIASLIESVSGTEGKKIVITATTRLGAFAGAEFFADGQVPFEYRDELNTTKLRTALTNVANAKGVTIYPMYFEGLAWIPAFDASRPGVENVSTTQSGAATASARDSYILMNETTALQDIAADTGGLTAWGSKDVASLFPRIGDELVAYYSLGYSSKTTRTDVARRIVVTTKNPDYIVRSRRQFVEISDATRMTDRIVANLFQPIEGSTIPFEVLVGPALPVGKNRWTTTLTIRIPVASLMTLKQGEDESGSFSVFVTGGAMIGSLNETKHETQTFTITAADRERAKTAHFTYDFVMELDQIAHRASVGVLDEVSKEFGLKRVDLPKR